MKSDISLLPDQKSPEVLLLWLFSRGHRLDRYLDNNAVVVKSELCSASGIALPAFFSHVVTLLL